MSTRDGTAGLADLALGGTAGGLCARIGTPIPWMPSPPFALAALRVAGAAARSPAEGFAASAVCTIDQATGPISRARHTLRRPVATW
jgi:hypothetical protein